MTLLDNNVSKEAELQEDLEARLFQSRQLSTSLAKPLTDEDQVVQASADASPTKWHLAHTTWFYETFVLCQHLTGYQVFDESFNYCFNSYYNAIGERHPRPTRGLLTRPSADLVRAYRKYVDEALAKLLASGVAAENPAVAQLIEIGINHEQQHQELLLTDILALFVTNPLNPSYSQYCGGIDLNAKAPTVEWLPFEGGIYEIGHAGDDYHFDCETPRHETLLQPFKLASQLVTNAEWLEFMSDGGYEQSEFWLSDGWDMINKKGWRAPGYWRNTEDGWHQMTLRGLLPVEPAAPVSHISFYEADAFARWADKRLPTEAEWEVAARQVPNKGNMLSSRELRPVRQRDPANGQLQQIFGDVWEWTQSPFTPYPKYRANPGALGEYNGKFMSGQYVLRGASCATVDGHSRPTYRNFFYPHQRWQFMGLRLAEDI